MKRYSIFFSRGAEIDWLEILNYLRELLEGNYRIIYSLSEERVSVHTIVDSRRNLEEVLIQKLQLDWRIATL